MKEKETKLSNITIGPPKSIFKSNQKFISDFSNKK